MRSYIRRRKGFTLIELLVVIAIIGVLIALLLPAVQAARESARTSQCLDHLKQIGIAFHSFQSAHGHLPNGARDHNSGTAYNTAGMSVNSCCNSRDKRGFSWSYWILPYMEQNNLFDLAIDEGDPALGSTGTYNPGQDTVARAMISAYLCPSRRGVEPYSSGFYRSDYAGNAGERITGYNLRNHDSNGGKKGVVIQTDRDKIRVEQITDGASHTLMVAEKGLHPDAHGVEGGDNERWNNAGWDEDVIRFGAFHTGIGLTPVPDQLMPSPKTTPAWKDPKNLGFGEWNPYFGGPHSGGVATCMADGSVRLVSFEINDQIFRRLSLAKDNLPIDDF